MTEAERGTVLEFSFHPCANHIGIQSRSRQKGLVMSWDLGIGTAEGPIGDGRGGLLAHGATTCLIFKE